MLILKGSAFQRLSGPAFPGSAGVSPAPEAAKMAALPGGAGTVTITRNEMLYALNQADQFLLAIVLVGENDTVAGHYYLRNPFDAEPGWGCCVQQF